MTKKLSIITILVGLGMVYASTVATDLDTNYLLTAGITIALGFAITTWGWINLAINLGDG